MGIWFFIIVRLFSCYILRQAWSGKKENVNAAQQALLVRCKANSDAQRGKYAGSGKAGESLYVANYKY